MRLDVVICTYNNAQSLGNALAALAVQDVRPDVEWAVTVVDNNCTDHTAQVVAHYQASGRIPRLTKVDERRQGLTYARTRGIAATTGDWIAFVDDDCLLASTWIQSAHDAASRSPRCGAFGGRVVPKWPREPDPMIERHKAAYAAQDRGSDEIVLPGRLGALVGAGLVVRRSALIASGWVDEQFLVGREGRGLGSGDDSEIVARVAAAGFELKYVPGCHLQHVIPERRVSREYLLGLYRGFGVADPFLIGLTYDGRYCSWLFLAALRMMVHASRAARLALFRSSREAAGIAWVRTAGELDGVWRIVRQQRSWRRRWLGAGTARRVAAKPGPTPP